MAKAKGYFRSSVLRTMETFAASSCEGDYYYIKEHNVTKR